MANASPTLPLGTGIYAYRLTVQTNNINAAKSTTSIAGDSNFPIRKLWRRFYSDALGAFRSNITVTPNAIYASDLVTFSSLANADTVTVNGRVYTAETSGATGLQQFNLGTTDTTAATNFAAILNADTSTAVKGVVTAVASAATITLYCQIPGNVGLQCTAAISAHGTVATANFTGGSEGTSGTIGHGL